MKKLKQGKTTIEIADHIYPPAKAGTMSADDLKRIPKARTGVGAVCDGAADAIEQLEGEFTAPKSVTSKSLREAGRKAEDVDAVVNDVEQMLAKLKQANLIFDAEALELLGSLNDQVKAQGKRNERVRLAFSGLTAYFANETAKKTK